MRLDEIAWRIRGLAGAQCDVARVPLQLYPKLKKNTFADPASFRPGFSCSAHLDGFDFEKEWPTVWRDKLTREAEQLCRDRLSFFDLEDQFLGSPIDWHRDHSANRAGPMRHCTFVDYRDFEKFGDCKLVWEPNRHHQLVVLARAYLVSRNERYAQKVIDLIMNWIDANPFGMGMNWKSPLELGVRTINWVWALDLIRASEALANSDWHRIVENSHLMIWDTQRKFSRGSSANNHLIGEVAGVFVGSSYFSKFKNARRYSDVSRDILEEQIILQTFGDGCTREHAFGYQYFVLQFFIICAFVAEQLGTSFSTQYMERLRKMIHFYSDICADTGSPPNLGDADSGYVLDPGDKPTNARSIISAGLQLFDDRAIESIPVAESCFWLWGSLPGKEQSSPPIAASHAYTESGYFVLRASPKMHTTRHDIRVFFDCAELGFGTIAAHGHADCLSFELCIDGLPILVDSGTYDYFTHPELREYFRSTKAHNVLTVDDQSQSVSSGPFMWTTKARQTLLEWTDNAEHSIVVGEHDGYSRLANPVIHRRNLKLDKQDGSLSIVDRLSGNGAHQIRRYFHTAPGCRVDIVDRHRIRIALGDIDVLARHDSNSAEVIKGDHRGQLGWVSNGYHKRDATHTIVLTDTYEAETSSDLTATFKLHSGG